MPEFSEMSPRDRLFFIDDLQASVRANALPADDWVDPDIAADAMQAQQDEAARRTAELAAADMVALTEQAYREACGLGGLWKGSARARSALEDIDTMRAGLRHQWAGTFPLEAAMNIDSMLERGFPDGIPGLEEL